MQINKVHLPLLAWAAAIFVGIFLLTSRPVSNLAAVVTTPLQNTNGRTNLLVLGMGGGNHDAPDLTDTIIFASLDQVTGKITTISIPRDLWIDSLSAKINHAYHLGGIKQVKSTVSSVLNQPIHFAFVLDFSAFTKAIDLASGIDVEVEKAFTDNLFPIPGKENDLCDGDPEYLCRYETISFDQGKVHMDGATALKFVRSRHSQDLAEGTDFARSKRQSQVVTAFQKKLLSNPTIIPSLSKLASKTVLTDLPQNQYLPLSNFLYKNRNQTLKSFALVEPDQLFHPENSRPYGGQWVLIPKNNDPRSITDFVAGIL